MVGRAKCAWFFSAALGLCVSAWPNLAAEETGRGRFPICTDQALANGQACLWRGPLKARPAFDQLARAQEAIDEKRFEEAYLLLNELIENPKLNAYERASVWQIMAHFYAEQDNYGGAINSFQQSVAERKADGTPALPKAQWLSTRYNIGQLQMVLERHADAAHTLDAWLNDGGERTPSALALLATARFQSGAFDKALVAIEEAIAASPAPNERWIALRSAIMQSRAARPEPPP